MLKHPSSDSTENCSHCEKNSELMKKYEHLVHLYRKKQLKDSDSQISHAPTTSNSSAGAASELALHRLALLLKSMIYARCAPFFWRGGLKSGKKLVVLTLSNRLQKYSKRAAFHQILSHSSKKSAISGLAQLLTDQFKGRLGAGFNSIKTSSGNSVAR